MVDIADSSSVSSSSDSESEMESGSDSEGIESESDQQTEDEDGDGRKLPTKSEKEVKLVSFNCLGYYEEYTYIRVTQCH